METLPTTDNFSAGVVVPIPTFPLKVEVLLIYKLVDVALTNKAFVDVTIVPEALVKINDPDNVPPDRAK